MWCLVKFLILFSMRYTFVKILWKTRAVYFGKIMIIYLFRYLVCKHNKSLLIFTIIYFILHDVSPIRLLPDTKTYIQTKQTTTIAQLHKNIHFSGGKKINPRIPSVVVQSCEFQWCEIEMVAELL